MKPLRPRQMFLQWTSRLALAAMLALVALPTFGRLHAGLSVAPTADAAAAIAVDAVHAAHGDGHATRRPAQPDDGHRGHADCPYCPLLGQLAEATHPLPLLATAPDDPAPSLTVATGHAGLRSDGLHARGPPTPA